MKHVYLACFLLKFNNQIDNQVIARCYWRLFGRLLEGVVECDELVQAACEVGCINSTHLGRDVFRCEGCRDVFLILRSAIHSWFQMMKDLTMTTQLA